MKKKKKKKKKVWCVDGLCKGEVFDTELDKKQLRVVTPNNYFYKMAVYSIIDKITVNDERVAIFVYGVRR